MMSKKSRIMVCEGKNIYNKYQKERCTNSSIHSPLIVTTCIEEMWTKTIVCVLTKKNGSLDYRMHGLTTGGKQESLNRDKFVFMSQVFSKEGRRIQDFKFDIVL